MAPPLLPRGAALLLLRSAARRPAAASSRGFLSSAAAGGREGALAAAAVAVVGSGLGLWLVPPSLADSGEAVADAPAGQISVGSGSGAVGAVEERGRKRRFLLGGELRFCFLSPPPRFASRFTIDLAIVLMECVRSVCASPPPPPLSRDACFLYFSTKLYGRFVMFSDFSPVNSLRP